MDSTPTIIIPTFQRRNRLKKSIRYWKRSKFKIAIADGSSLSNADLIPEGIDYYWRPKISIFDRWFSVIQSVRTKYFVLCADDDFIGFNAIERCVSFLEDNQDYSCAQGCYHYFKDKGSHFLYGNIYGGIESYPLFEPNFELRFYYSLRYYFHTIYSVQRTENALKFLDRFPKLSNDNAFEMQFTLGNSLFGKHKIFPFLYGVREIIEGSAGQITQNLIDWIETDRESFLVWRDFFVCKMLDTLALGKMDAERLFDEAISGYHQHVLESKGLRSGQDLAGFDKAKTLARNVVKRLISKKILDLFNRSKAKAENGESADLVRLTKETFGEGSTLDAQRIQQAIMGHE
jgi:glycosyltransferase domain-containing protein